MTVDITKDVDDTADVDTIEGNIGGNGNVADDIDEFSRLTRAAEDLVDAIDRDAYRLSDEAHRLVDKLRERRFDVVVLGEFNRGKSSLLNALLGRDILPTGALPVTSIATELATGPDRVVVRFRNGSEQDIEFSELSHFITEEGNPGNLRNVASVRVTIASPALREGAVLIDTPGIGSVFRQASEASREAIGVADGAIVVLSADTPLTDLERWMIRMIGERQAPVFFVLNRIDHLDPDELEKVQWFVESVLTEARHSPQLVYPVSAKRALAHRRNSELEQDKGFSVFASALDAFLVHGLDNARLERARLDITRLADRLDNECAVETSALEMSRQEIEERLNRFSQSSSAQREAFEDDVVLLRHAVDRLARGVEERLAAMAGGPSDEAERRLAQIAEQTERVELATALNAAIQQELHTALEPVREHEEVEAERAWRRAAERFELATQRRTDRLRDIASDLFDISLRHIAVPGLSAQQTHFAYSPPIVLESTAGGLSRMMEAMRSERKVRSRQLEAAQIRLAEELRSHAQRASADISERLEFVCSDLEQAMEEQVADVVDGTVQAIERAQSAKQAAAEREQSYRQRAERLRRVAAKARDAAASEVISIDLRSDAPVSVTT